VERRRGEVKYPTLKRANSARKMSRNHGWKGVKPLEQEVKGRARKYFKKNKKGKKNLSEKDRKKV